MKFKFIKTVSALTLATSLLALSGCASYESSSLSALGDGVVEYGTEENPSNVIVKAKAFDKQDCMKYLDRDVISEGYQPVQLFIKNNSDKNYIFSPVRISLPLARTEEVAEKVHTSTVGRVLGYWAGSLVLFPLIVPAIVDGVKSSQANTSLDRDFAAKAAKEHVLYSNTSSNMVLFVPKESFTETFTVTLAGPTPNDLQTFTVNCR